MFVTAARPRAHHSFAADEKTIIRNSDRLSSNEAVLLRYVSRICGASGVIAWVEGAGQRSA
jgi:hypothetical protein